MNEKLKSEYEKLAKKYNLPSFEFMDNEFEISVLKVDESGILIKAILRMILSKLGTFLNYFEPVFNPSPSMHSMTEMNNLKEAEKEEIVILYKKISIIYHQILYKELENEKSIADFIKDFCKSWPSTKNEVIKSLKSIENAWKN